MFCYICKERDKQVTYHVFPKNVELRQLWLFACGFKEVDIMPRTTICGKHFEESCFHIPNLKTGKKQLIRGSIPSKYLSKKGRVKRSIESTEGCPTNKQLYQGSILRNAVPETSSQDTNEVDDGIENLPESDGAVKSITFDEMQIEQPFTPISHLESNVKELHTPVSKAVKRIEKFRGFDSPQRAKRHYSHAVRTIVSLKQRVKGYQQRVRRLTKKIDQLENLLAHLKQKGLISEEAEMGSTSDSIKEICKRALRHKTKKISPKLRSFALTLHFYSPKAYNYVRKSFKNVLPHEKTLSKWFQVLNGNPEFTSEAFDAIKEKAESNEVPFVN